MCSFGSCKHEFESCFISIYYGERGIAEINSYFETGSNLLGQDLEYCKGLWQCFPLVPKLLQ